MQSISRSDSSTSLGMTLNRSIGSFPLIGPTYAKKLERLGILTIDDLLHHYPFRYDDLSLATSIDSLKEGETVTLSGTIMSIKSIRTRTGKTMQQAIFSDGSGLLKINWFNQPFLVRNFQNNPQVSLSGKVKMFAGKPTLSSPQYEPIKHDSTLNTQHSTLDKIHTGRLVPVYPETAGVSSKWLRSRINSLMHAVSELPEYVPQLALTDIPSYDWSIRNIHFPTTLSDASKARQRLAFDELLLWQLVAQLKKRMWNNQPNPWNIPKITQDTLKPFIESLPFKLTNDQLTALNDVCEDLNAPHPMNRLLQGDVGSGKTIVAGAIMYALAGLGLKSALMAPTEILANQHFETLQKILKPYHIKIVLATRSKHDDTESADIVIGTHALLHRPLPKNLALLVIDEQHRFGVTQRSQLLQVKKIPHLLSMTATPIPRTIALTLYAELDVSIIKEMPLGRKQIKTWVVPEHKRKGAYVWIKQQIQKGEQAFVVCPLIDQSENQNMSDIKAVTIEYNRLKNDVFKDQKLGLIHGKLKSAEKDATIKAFADKKIDILVATSVVEVGIDIKNATMMLIEGAERFGLAQLHQLRGRVGRSDQQSYCLLFSTSENVSQNRLKHLETIQSGFDLAEIDLKLRGPGNVYGQQQSGFIDLKLASFNDQDLIVLTHKAAKEILVNDPNLTDAPILNKKIESMLSRIAEPN